MGCSSCSTEKDGKPGGCRSNGTCGTGGCNKLNVFNWLTDMALPAGQAPYSIVEVRFKGSRKEFFHNKENIEIKTGDTVAVEAIPGHDVGVVSLAGELVRFQLKKKGLDENSDQIKTLYRKAKQNEVEKWFQVRDLEPSTLNRTRAIIQSLKLNMKLSDVEFQGDGKKATFYYTADDRVDFRELIKRLADEFKVRVDMRQIGMRQEAGRLGGIGSCGRELCCSTWLTDFKTVSTSAARYQNLALNPAKLAGQCGKLKCCLNFELDSYMDTLKDFPSTNISLETEKGKASHRKTDIFKRLMWFGYDVREVRDRQEEGGDGGGWVVLSVDRVKEIIELNKKQVKPVDLKDFEEEVIDTTPDFENVVGQDRIDRMDKIGKKKKKKKKRSGQPQGTVAQQQQAGAPQQEGQQNKKPQQQPGRNQQQRNPNQQRQQQGKRNPQQSKPQQPEGQQPRPQQQNKPQQSEGQQPKPQQQNRNRPQRQQPSKPTTPPENS